MASAPTRDIGHPDLSWADSAITGAWWETSADLLFPQSTITYARMRNDPQIQAVLSAYTLPLRRATWAVDPAGCKDKVVKHVADDLGLSVLGTEDKGPGPARRRGVMWGRHLQEALTYLTFGHAVFERRYRPEGRLLHLDNLGARPQWTLSEIHTNPDGTVKDVLQVTQREPIPASSLAWYVRGLEGAAWQGQSMLRCVYGAWLLKSETWRVHASAIRRWGMGVPQVTAPPGATEAQLAQARQLATSMRAGDQAGMGLPQGYSAEILGMTGSVPDALGFIEYLDRAIAKMALAGLIELGQTETGSRALGETFLDLFLLSLQGVADEVALAATSGFPGLPGIVTDLVDQNYGEDEPAPRIVCTDVGESYEASADAITALVTSGALTPDTELDAWIRKTWRLPEKAEPLPGEPLPGGGLPGQPAGPEGGPGTGGPVPASQPPLPGPGPGTTPATLPASGVAASGPFGVPSLPSRRPPGSTLPRWRANGSRRWED